ncbi:MAG TPA: hypothetical protein QF703_03925 [Candidatus Thalassarchaeaceae archaeon]|nr:hypothetical protein [Candidatus Thalassarchaeaceae archaeon]
MALECNIDSRGKAFRLRIGLIAIIAGIGLALLSFTEFEIFGFGVHWIVPSAVLAGGSFSIFESWSGWCIARAMGFRTSI